MPSYSGSYTSGEMDRWLGLELYQPAAPAAYRTGVADAAYFGKQVQDNVLALIRSSVASPYYSQTCACASGLTTGQPVYISDANTVALAAASGSGTSKVVGFIRDKTAADTGCYVAHFWHQTGLTCTTGATLYLTDAGGVSTTPGTFVHALGIGMSTTGGCLVASPLDATLRSTNLGGASVAVGTGVADSGTGTFAARYDHVHAMAFSGTPGAVGTGSGSSGTSLQPARLDHTHTIRNGWRDLVVEIQNAATSGTTPATFDLIGGTGQMRGWRFDLNDELTFNAEMIHDYMEGSDLHPHLHWVGETASGTEPLRFVIDLQWRGTGEIYTLSGTGQASYSGSGTAGTGLVQRAMELELVTGTSKGIGSILTGRLRRITNGATDYTGNVFVLQFGFHYQMDSLGSTNEWSK